MIYIHYYITNGNILLDVRHLRHLVTIADEGTLAKASERLHITQPALTKSIHALETFLDTQLFEREGRRLKLTDLGASLVDQGRNILRSVADTEKMVRDWGTGVSGHITIGLGPAYTVLLSTQLIETVVKDHEAVQLRLETGDTDSLVARLIDDTVDIAVCDLAGPPPAADIQAIELTPQPIVALVKKGHPLNRIASPSLSSLAGYSVGHSPAPAQFASVGNALSASSSGESLCLSENYEALVQVTRATDMVTLLPLNLAQTYEQQGDVVIVALSDLPQSSMPKILYRETARSLSPLGHQLIRHIKSRFATP